MRERPGSVAVPCGAAWRGAWPTCARVEQCARTAGADGGAVRGEARSVWRGRAQVARRGAAGERVRTGGRPVSRLGELGRARVRAGASARARRGTGVNRGDRGVPGVVERAARGRAEQGLAGSVAGVRGGEPPSSARGEERGAARCAGRRRGGVRGREQGERREREGRRRRGKKKMENRKEKRKENGRERERKGGRDSRRSRRRPRLHAHARWSGVVRRSVVRDARHRKKRGPQQGLDIGMFGTGKAPEILGLGL